MKAYNLLFLFLFLSGCLFSQSVRVIDAETDDSGCFSDKEFERWDKYYKIMHTLYDSDGNQIKKESDLTEAERQYIEDMRQDDEYETEPWNVLGPGCSWYCGAMYEMHASSTLSSAGGNTYTVDNLWDDDVRTAWVEGVKGYGIGEYIVFDFPEGSPRATDCNIVNGYAKSEKTWKNNSRVKTLNVYENDKLVAIVNLKDKRCVQNFPLENHRQQREAMQLKFVITEVYKGDKYDDTAISELIFEGMDVHCLASGTQVTMADGSTKPIEAISVGDNVKTFIPTVGIVSSAVKQIHAAGHSGLLRLTLSSGIHIIATDDHPFWSEKGWLSANPNKTRQYARFHEVAKYAVGDKLFAHVYNDVVAAFPIIKIERLPHHFQTYTLELETDGGFIANGFVVGQE
ncbi:MAG: hypothetical protein LBD45_08815 [Bacteroidales bacterium]|jgi:hypothetical protein|nr:hypothetical protein [Bacteroidales bacterium]